MTVRIRLDDRDELISNRDGFGELRQAILNADASGNLQLLTQLQTDYRRRIRAVREAAQGRATSSPKLLSALASFPSPVAPKVLRTPERELAGVLLNLGPQPTAMESGEAVMLDVTPESVRGWLANTEPADVPLVVHHETEPCGHFVMFIRCDGRIETVAVADDTPAGALMLRGCDDGTLPGFSIGAKIIRSHPTGQVVRGLPLIVADEITIFEAGPSIEPSDSDALITLVRGRQPRWQQAQAAVEAAEALRNMRPSPSRRGGSAQAWRPVFGRA